MYNQRDILIIPIPYTDMSTTKRRPVMVLSNDKYNSSSDDIIVVGITSNISNKEYAVLLDNSGMEFGNIPKTSNIRADKIYALSQKIVVKKYGRVNKITFKAVVQKLNDLIE